MTIIIALWLGLIARAVLAGYRWHTTRPQRLGLRLHDHAEQDRAELHGSGGGDIFHPSLNSQSEARNNG